MRARSLQILGLVALLCACIPRAGSERAPVLRIGTSGDYAPFSLDGEGFDIEVARRLASDLGYRIEWLPFAWPELEARMARGDFDLVMSGVTWRVRRAVIAPLSLAVAVGGPCLLSRAGASERIVVNAGGFLESWVRAAYPDARITAVAANRSLPDLLASREFDALATDRFELASFRREGWSARCEPPIHAKAYWVSERRHPGLLAKLDAWIRSHPDLLRELSVRYFDGAVSDGDPANRQLADLVRRRLALMPHVASWKRARDIAIEDPKRERLVLARTRERAALAGLGPAEMEAFVALQIEFAKRVQRRSPAPDAAFDLLSELRPRLLELAGRMQDSIAAGARLDPAASDLLDPWLEESEIAALLELPLAAGPE